MTYWSVKNDPPKEDIDFRALNLYEWEYRILLNRGLDTVKKIKDFLNPSPSHISSVIGMKDVVKAGNIVQKIEGKIRIIGDYDCDGTMGTTILLKGLRGLGYDVDYDIPHRRKDGYGMQISMAEKAAADDVKLIITCDNGIAQFDAIDRAKALGLQVIVIDHHQVVREAGKEKLPKADAVIDPHQTACSYPFKALCAGALAFYFIKYLYSISGKLETMDPDFIGFATLATICDVMPLQGENRDLIVSGLKRLNETDHLGLNALREAAGIRGDIQSYHVGFVIGPTINAAGRLASAKEVVELFLTDDEERAKKIAVYLRELNSKRQMLTVEATRRLEAQLALPKEREQLLYILKDETIDESIAGIVAGKLKEKYHRPCIVITRGERGLKGSGRSIEAYNMVENIQKSAHHLNSFGGHAMACGLSLDADRFVPFKIDVLENSPLNVRDLVPRIRLDAILPIDQVNLHTVARLERFQPFGNGNPKPLFGARGIGIRTYRVFGKNKNVIRMTLVYKDREYDGIMFQPAEDFKAFLDSTERSKGIPLVDMAYVPKVDTYQNKNTLQFQIEELRQAKRGG